MCTFILLPGNNRSTDALSEGGSTREVSPEQDDWDENATDVEGMKSSTTGVSGQLPFENRSRSGGGVVDRFVFISIKCQL